SLHPELARGSERPRKASKGPARGSGAERSRQLAGHLDLAEEREHVAFLDVLDTLETDPALEAGLHRLHVVLLALERDHLGFRHFDAATIAARLEVALHAAALHPAAGDHADLGDAENLEDLGFTRHFLAVLGLQHAFHRRLDFIHDFVDDAVAVDGHAF